MAIAFNSFIEAKRGNPIDFCQFAIQDDPDAADSAAQRAALTIEVRIAEAFPEDQAFVKSNYGPARKPPKGQEEGTKYEGRIVNWDAEIVRG